MARKLKALEDDVAFQYSILKDAREILNTELSNITQLKNENKCYASARFDALENECSLLKTKLQKVEQENQKLKPVVGEHKKKTIALLQSKISSLHESTTTPSHLPNGQRSLPQLEHTSHPSQIPSLIATPPPSFSAVLQRQSTPSTKHPGSCLLPSPPCVSSSPSTVSTADYATPVQNRFDVLNSTPGSITCEASAASPPQYIIPVHISERDNVRHEPPATPAQQMTQTTILQATDYLLIGDSTIKQISPNKMNTGEYFCVQKICVPSMKTIDLLHWLE